MRILLLMAEVGIIVYAVDLIGVMLGHHESPTVFNALKVLCEAVMLITMYLLVIISGLLSYLTVMISKACKILDESITLLHQQMNTR